MRFAEFNIDYVLLEAAGFDPDVEADQKILKHFGYDLGPTGVNGIITPATEKAIAQFNKDYDSGRLDKAKVKAAHAKFASPKSSRPVSTGKIMLPARGPITQQYGKVSSRGKHQGVDIGVPVGTPVVAPDNGTVISAGNAGSRAGIGVVIQSGNQVHKLFHLSQVKVSAGDMVKKGQVVALSGNTGRSTGPHLHWEKHVAGAPTDPMSSIG